MGQDLTNAELKQIVSSLNIVGEQYITFTEFKAALLGLDFFSNYRLLRIVFDYFDTVGDGNIDHQDLIKCFRRFGRQVR